MSTIERSEREHASATKTATRPARATKKFTTFKNTSTARQQTLDRKLARKIKYGR